MSDRETLSFLREVEIFEQVAPTTLSRVADLFDSRIVADGEILFREGDPGGYVFLIAEGSLEVTHKGVYQLQCGSGESSYCAAELDGKQVYRRKAGGDPVLLQDSQAKCKLTDSGVTVTVQQTRVKGK